MELYNQKLGQAIKTDVPGVSADKGFIAHINMLNVAAGDSDSVLSETLFDVAPKVITTNITNPDVPRTLNITSTVASVNIVVEGTNMLDEVITETINTDDMLGLKAFKTVTKITLPAALITDTISVGFGPGLGLPYKLSADSVILATKSGSKVVDLSTFSADDIELNVISFNNGFTTEEDVDIFVIV
jgi:hypothetical protein